MNELKLLVFREEHEEKSYSEADTVFLQVVPRVQEFLNYNKELLVVSDLIHLVDEDQVVIVAETPELYESRFVENDE